MIACVCFQCGKLEQQFRRDDRFCERCGKLKTRVQIWMEGDKPIVKIAVDGE